MFIMDERETGKPVIVAGLHVPFSLLFSYEFSGLSMDTKKLEMNSFFQQKSKQSLRNSNNCYLDHQQMT
jgi:hypothetical protein